MALPGQRASPARIALTECRTVDGNVEGRSHELQCGHPRESPSEPSAYV